MTYSFYRRNLPHWQPEGRTIFLTWRLYGSLPKGFTSFLAKWDGLPGKRFVNADRFLDTTPNGPLWLKEPEIAGCAEQAILRGADLGHYELRAYVVMPNHIHVLLETLVPIQKLMGGIKGVSARHANLKLGRMGTPFWQDESFDHWIRNEGEFARTKAYIENNPVKAGFCAKPEDWPWSSAHKF